MNRYNHEGYPGRMASRRVLKSCGGSTHDFSADQPDPAAAEAIANIIKEEKAARAGMKTYRPLVYMASPFAGDAPANIRCAKEYFRFAVNKGWFYGRGLLNGLPG